MKISIGTQAVMALLAGAAVVLTGCESDSQGKSRLHMADDFGQALNADLKAQIAYPDGHWDGPAPPSSGNRAALAQDHYTHDAVTEPNLSNTLSSGSTPGGTGGSGGGSSGGGGGGGPQP
jgi:hypothetical protein